MIDFRQLFEHSPNPYVLLDRGFRFVEMNAAYLRVTGRTRGELLGVGMFEAFPGDPTSGEDSGVRELRASLQRVLDSGTADVLGLIRYSIPVRTEAGVTLEERYWSATHTPLVDADGHTRFILQNTMDVTELQRLKTELKHARREQDLPMEQLHGGILARAQGLQEANRLLDSQRQHLLQLFDEAPGFMAYLSGPEHRFELVNPAYTRLVGGRAVTGLTVKEALPDVEGQGFIDLLDRVYTGGEPFVGRGMEVHLRGPAGDARETRHVDFVYQPVRGGDGTVVGILVQGHDITAQALAQAELRRHHTQLEALVQERTVALAQSEQALLHAQKLEAVGKLTGGVAHDFNNVLQVIGANLQLIQRHAGADDALQSRASSAMEAVARGARLSSQLLAFARQQPLRPVVFNLGERLRTLDEMLQRTLGETVEVRLAMEPGLANVEADVHQLENAVLNLAINSRDAMPHGGVLRISLRNAAVPEGTGSDGGPAGLEPGHYVALEVADTGHGMQPAVRQRAFEPFFTTKSEGQGTGLGLSMVYGFVKQSGGHVHIDSESGRGTTVTIYLPRVDAPSALPVEPVVQPADRMGRGEVILVVEDEEAVRRSTVETLRVLGYEVVEARDGAEALAMLRNGLRVDLLFSDVIMPGPVHSPELARLARELQPGIAVLFTSGYTRDVVFHDGRLDAGVELLDKPYLREDLAIRLRKLLDRPAHAGLRILLVEDDADNRRLLSDLLELSGHAVTAVADAASASAAAGAGFDVLLTDVRLPDKAGPVLAAELRQRDPTLAVLFMSGHSVAELREMGWEVTVLHKPFHPDVLEAALRRAQAEARSALRGVAGQTPNG